MSGWADIVRGVMTPRRSAAVAVLLALSVVVGGCGDEEFSTREVIDHFQERTGDGLVRAPNSPKAWDTLDLPEPSRAERDLTARDLKRYFKYGSFTIYVVKDRSLFEGFLEGKPDSRGIHWERERRRDGPFPSWRASKRYANVVLVWRPVLGRGTDRSWERLNRVLEDMLE